MTREEWTQLSRQVSAAWPGDPIDADQDALYFEVLKGLTQDQVANGILGIVRDGAASRPTAGDLYRASAPPSSSAATPLSRQSRLIVDVSNTPMPSAPRAASQAYPLKPVALDPAASLMSGRGAGGYTAAATGANGMATAGMILGIAVIPLILLANLTLVAGVLVWIASPLAIVFSSLGLRRANARAGTPGKGQAIAGLVLGILGAVLLIIGLILVASEPSSYYGT